MADRGEAPTGRGASVVGWALALLATLGPGAGCTGEGPAAVPSVPQGQTQTASPECGPAEPAPAEPNRQHQLLQTSHRAEILQLRVSATGKVASLSRDGTVRVWDGRSRALLKLVPDANVGGGVAWSRDGQRLYASVDPNRSPHVTVLDLANAAAPTALATQLVPLAATAQTDQLLALEWGKPVVVGRDFAPSAPLAAAPSDAAAGSEWAVAKDGTALVRFGARGAVVWRGATDQAPTALRFESSAPSPEARGALSPDAKSIALLRTVSADALALELRELGGAGTVRVPLDPDAGWQYPQAIDWSSDGAWIAFTALGRVAVYRVAGAAVTPVWTKTAEELRARPMQGLFDPGNSFGPLAFTPDGALLVAFGDGSLLQVDPASGLVRGAFGEVARAPTELVFQGKDRLFARAGDTVTAWSVARAELASRATVHPGDRTMVTRDGLITAVQEPLMASACSADQTPLAVEHRADFVEPPTERPGLAPSWDKPAAAPLTWPPRMGLSTHCLARELGLLAASGSGRWVFQAGVARGASKPTDASLQLLELASGKTTTLADSAPPSAAFGAAWTRAQLSRSERRVIAMRELLGGSVAVWDAATGKPLTPRISVVDASPSGVIQWPGVSDAVLSSDDAMLAVAYLSRLEIHRLGATSVEKLQLPGESIERLGFANTDASTLFAATASGKLVVFKSGKQVASGASDESSGGVLALAVDPTDTLVATAHSDGGVRVWDAKTAALRATFADFEDDEHVVFSPAGAYTGSDEVADRIAWVFDGPTEAFDFEQFGPRSRNAELVRKRLAGDSGDLDVRLSRPPVAEILGPATVSGNVAKLRVRVASSQRVDKVRLFVDGRPAAAQQVCAKTAEVELEGTLLRGQNRLSAVAFDASGSSSSAATVFASASAGARPNLQVLAIGVSRYPHLDGALQLAVADDDARAIAKALSQAGARTYGSVSSKVLVDAEATPEAIRGALDALRSTKPEDVVVVSFAGHGILLADGSMVFATGAIRAGADDGIDGASAATAAIGWSDISAALAQIPGRVLVLLDACHAGHVTRSWTLRDDTLAERLARRGGAGAVVFTAAKGRQLSFEPANARAIKRVRLAASLEAGGGEGNGLFTSAFLEALRSPTTDVDGNGRIELSEIITRVTRSVVQRSGGLQTPWVARRDLFGDFALLER